MSAELTRQLLEPFERRALVRDPEIGGVALTAGVIALGIGLLTA